MEPGRGESRPDAEEKAGSAWDLGWGQGEVSEWVGWDGVGVAGSAVILCGLSGWSGECVCKPWGLCLRGRVRGGCALADLSFPLQASFPQEPGKGEDTHPQRPRPPSHFKDAEA